MAAPLSHLSFASAALIFALALTGCATLQPSDFQNDSPTLDPTVYFAGHARSFGVLENEAGTPTQTVATETIGRWQKGMLDMEQEITFGHGRHQHRSWHIRRLDAHHFEATANDVVGTPHGEAYGNVFHWTFILATSPGNPLLDLRASQWWYLGADGRTLVVHSVFTKADIFITQVTEQFHKS